LRRRAGGKPFVEERPGYRLVRSNRRTCALEVTPEGRLIVRAPKGLADRRIELLINRHSRWIEGKQRALTQRAPSLSGTGFQEGDRLPFLGEGYPLHYVEATEGMPAFRFDGQFLVSRREQPRARILFKEWCRLQARSLLREKAQSFSALAGVEIRNIRITDARKRWGSCGIKGTLNFTWRLIMAPSEIVDYVVVHELAHLKEQSHSKRFWQYVRAILPDFEARRRRLRELEHALLML
jgi:predicted metal-dependent hydrolase